MKYSVAKKVTLLLDSDIIAYKIASSSQQNFDWSGSGSIVSVVEDMEDVIPVVREYIDELALKLKATDLIVCLSCPSEENFRYQVLPSYKHNRKDTIKPVLLQAIKDWMRENYPTYERPTLEADDIMGILSTHPDIIEGKKIVVSEDKDLKTIPGWLYNPRKDTKASFISQGEADGWHLYQTLVGDTTDGYKGCPKVGPVNAQKILEPFTVETKHDVHVDVDAAWKAVVSTFESKGLTEEDALVQARVARICRHTDYDFDKKEVILWTPYS